MERIMIVSTNCRKNRSIVKLNLIKPIKQLIIFTVVDANLVTRLRQNTTCTCHNPFGNSGERSSRNLSTAATRENLDGAPHHSEITTFSNEIPTSQALRERLTEQHMLREPCSFAYESTAASNIASRRSRNRPRHRIAEFLASHENRDIQSEHYC